MRLLCITAHGGALHTVRPEAELYIGLERLGAEVTVMTRADSCYVERMRAAGIRVLDFQIRRKIELHAIRRIRREIREGRHDIVYALNNKAIANAALAAVGQPVVLVSYRGITGNIRRYDPTCYLTQLNPRIDYILCVARAVRDDLRKQVTRPERVVHVYKGHDLAWYGEPPGDPARLGIPKGAFVVALVANNRPRKGIDVLIDASRRLPPDLPIHFLVMGRDTDSAGIRGKITASPMAANFHLAGYRDDATALIAACDTLALPAMKREGLPRAVIEAMAQGVPPIVSDIGGNTELVIHGQSGLVVRPGDADGLAAAILELYQQPELCRALGTGARARIADEFCIDKTVRQSFDFFASILPRDPGNRAA